MKFAKWSFHIAGVYGLLFMLYMLFTEPQYSQSYPPAVTHLELLCGFILVTLVLFSRGQLAPQILAGGLIDLVPGTLFLVSYFKTRHRP